MIEDIKVQQKQIDIEQLFFEEHDPRYDNGKVC